MKSENLAKRFSESNKENSVLRIAVLICVVVILILSIALVQKSSIVTIVPSNLMSKSVYGEKTADKDALSGWGLYVANLLGNVTPSNANFVADVVGHILSPSIYKQVMGDLDTQVRTIKNDQLTLAFSASSVSVHSDDEVIVTGWLTTTDAHGSSKRDVRTYEFYFNVINYQPYITGLNAYAGAPSSR